MQRMAAANNRTGLKICVYSGAGPCELHRRRQAPSTQHTAHPDTIRNVLLVGHTVHDAHAITVQAMDKHAQTDSISALILSSAGSRRDVSISGILVAPGCCRDSLRVNSCHT